MLIVRWMCVRVGWEGDGDARRTGTSSSRGDEAKTG